MTKRRRIIHADKIMRNVVNVFCLLMFLQLKGFYSGASNPVLLYSTGSDIRVANISKPGKVFTIIKGLDQGSAVDFLYRRHLVCWSEQSAELIQCLNHNETYSGEKMRIVSQGLITPTGIAIDWYTDKIYWTDGETNRIEVISIDQKHRKVLFWSDVDLARGIAVVPKDGLLFWTDWGEIPKIERAGMNGDPTTRKVIVKDNIFWPNGITIDYDNNLIYWMDAKLQFVDLMDFNGDKRKRIVKGGLEYPYALTYFNDKLYWTDWKTWKIHSWDIATNGPMRDLIKSEPVPVDIRVYDSRRQQPAPENLPCNVNNGGCSHLCLLSPTPPGFLCSCPTGIKLRPGSNTTCYDVPQSLLLVAQRSMISKISLDSPDFTPYTLPLKELKRANTVDFDPKTEYIYWADSLAKTISRARLDGSEQSVVVHNSGVSDSIAIDALARNIYWTDPVADTINVARLDGSVRKVIIHDDLYDPRAIAVHPTAGWLFWSDWNEARPKIERSDLAGGSRVLLVSEKLTWPNGIALDTTTNRLYWGDARTHKIEVINMDGSNRSELHSSDILHIFGLTLLGSHLYWTDIQRRTLNRIDKTTGLDRMVVVDMPNMMGVKAFQLKEPAGHNECAASNGGCSHFCFNRPEGYICSCPLGLELESDGKTCVEPQAFLVYSRKNVIGRLSIEYDNNDAVLPIKDLKEVSALAVDVSGSKIYWSDSKTKTINRCSINGAHVEKILEGLGLVEGLAIDWSGQNIYWADSAAARIEAARLDGSSRRTLLWQGLKKPKSLALDPKRGYMYWSELGSKTIKRAAMDGSSPVVILEQVGRVHAITVDCERRALYWASLEPPAVESAALDGGARTTLADDTSMPTAVAVYAARVFWADWNTGQIEAANKDGSNRKLLHRGLDYISDLKIYHRAAAGGNQCGVDNGGCSHLCLPLPDAGYRCACPAHYRLTPDNLTCSGDASYTAGGNQCGVDNGGCSHLCLPLPDAGYRCACPAHYRLTPDRLTCSGDASYTAGGNQCGVDNGGCSHLCLPLPDAGYRCACPAHYRLTPDNLTCSGDASYTAGGNQCGVDNGGCSHLCLPLPDAGYRCACPAHYRLTPDNLTCSEPEEFLLFAQKNSIGRLMIANGECNDAVVPVTGLKNIKAIEFDSENKMLYWMDEESHSIRRVPISYSTTSAITDSTVVVSGLCRPFSMALDALGRALYWSCLDADSVNATALETNSTGVVLQGDNMLPRHLAFHQTKRLLIWNDVGLGAIMRAGADGRGRAELARAANATALTVAGAAAYWAVNKQIHAVDLDGRNKRIIWQGGWAGSLAVYGGALYLGGGERAPMRLPLHRRDAPAAPVPHLPRLAAALAVAPVDRTHPCYGGRACGGAVGACGADGACGCGLACRACAPRHFACAPAAAPRCIPAEWQCDGQADCPDGSDEAECCAGLRCADGACAATLGGCDAGVLCAPPAPPVPDAFRCDDRLCLGARLLCDGRAHCADGSDEAEAACAAPDPDRDPDHVTHVGSGRSSRAFAVCGGVAGALAAAAAAGAALRRWRRRPAPAPPPHLLAPLKLTERPPSLSSDSLGRYPRPTANPPPSPATASGASLPARRRPYRHYRAINRPPPPTPASTDAGESEPEHARAPPPSPAPLQY